MLEDTKIKSLQKRIRGRLLLPSDPAFDDARRIYNAAIDRHPALIVRCAETEDVAAAVQFAREHQLPLSVRAGGHNVSGNAVCEAGLMIDLSHMKSAQVEPQAQIARVGPGLTLGDFDRATTEQKLVTTMGVVSKTGVAGLSLGGGLGWLMGKYGLACDNLVGAEVVTAEGKRVHASAQENADLLWGLRGGGGNFGIVTQFEFQLHRLEPFLGGLLIHPLAKAGDLLRFYRDVCENAPDELVVYAALLNGPDGAPVSALAVGYCGDPATGEKLLKPIRAFGPPAADLVGPVPYVQQQTMFDAGYPPGLFHYWKSGFMNTLPDEAIGTVIEYFMRRPSPMNQAFFEYMHGEAARVPATAAAFPHRFDHYNFSGFGIWQDPAERDTNLGWIEAFWQEMRPFLSGRAYANYLGQEGPERVREAYGPNYARLQALKDKYDPTNLFRLNQNVQPTAAARRSSA